jgi:hypothetical protein
VQTELGRLVKKLLWFTALLYVAMFALIGLAAVYFIHQQNQNNKLAARATRAICNVGDTYRHQITDTKAFLAKHPNGIPGISAAILRKTITDAQTRVADLADVRCPKN